MKAIILARKNFRESDQIISFYTLEKGKLEVLARGVKKITSKNSARLEPFSFVNVEIIHGKELDYLGAVKSINFFKNIRNNLKKSLSTSYLVSTLNKLVAIEDEDKRIFVLLLSWLEFVDQTTKFNIVLLDAYIVTLLYCLGFDITESKKLYPELKKDLEILNSRDWKKITNYQLPITKYQKLHNFIYKFTVSQTEREFKNWLNFSKIF